MKVSLGWLREWTEWPDDEQLCERLTVGGLEIEEVIRSGPDLGALCVGEVLERAQHPDADRLSLCTVDVGAEEPVAIVCGAPNVAAGQKVAVALHGVTLPDGTKIKRSKIRGVRSNGMICSTRELGLGDEHEGILVLETEARPGAPLTDALSAGDVVLELEITPNRGDWVSMLGIARETRAHFGGGLCLPPSEPEESGAPAAEAVRVAIEDDAGCHRYVARVVRGVRVAASPAWLCARLEAAGLRPVNNVVDVTNLVMLEFGQPLHGFDLARIRGGGVRVRAAAPDEKIVTLDGQTRQLEAADLVIADAEGAIAVAGVMGGAESEVSERTQDVLLESAHFAPSRVRRTARRLGLHSDASYRFERGVDRDGVRRAADRAARLLAELCGGQVAPGAVEASGDPPPPLPPIRLEPARVNRLLGTALLADEMAALLARVDVAVAREGEALVCTPPSWRSDLLLPADLAEEVARIHGYDRIEATLPAAALDGVSEPPERSLGHQARDALAGAGCLELVTFAAMAEEDLDALRLAADDPRRRAVRVVNPIQAGAPLLRTTLVPSLLRAARQNFAHQVDALRCFEVSRVFRAQAAGELPDEPLEAVALVAGEAAGGVWSARETPVFFRAKGVAERLLADLERPGRFEAGSPEPYLHPSASGCYRLGTRALVHVGELHPDAAAAFGIEAPLALVVAELAAIGALPRTLPRHAPVPRHPRVRRDLALLVGADTAAGELLDAIRRAAGGSLREVALFDRYEGKGVPQGKVSLAFRLDFQREDRTLTDTEVAKATDKVVRTLQERFGGELR